MHIRRVNDSIAVNDAFQCEMLGFSTTSTPPTTRSHHLSHLISSHLISSHLISSDLISSALI